MSRILPRQKKTANKKRWFSAIGDTCDTSSHLGRTREHTHTQTSEMEISVTSVTLWGFLAALSPFLELSLFCVLYSAERWGISL